MDPSAARHRRRTRGRSRGGGAPTIPGEHFTPRDVVHLMVDLLLAGDRRHPAGGEGDSGHAAGDVGLMVRRDRTEDSAVKVHPWGRLCAPAR